MSGPVVPPVGGLAYLQLPTRDVAASLDFYAAALGAARTHGGAVVTEPWLDQGARMLAEVTDPAGTRLGLVGPVT